MGAQCFRLGHASSKVSPLVLSAEEVTTLEQWARRPKTAQALALRSRIPCGTTHAAPALSPTRSSSFR